MNLFVVIPYFSGGVEVNTNDVKVFLTRQAAYEYTVKERFSTYDIVCADYLAQ